MLTDILAPAAVLVAWSLVMLVWMAATRLPAVAKSGIDLKTAPPGGRGQDLESVLDPQVMWKSHNYAHLMEQPTIFYALVLILALSGSSTADVLFAWAYVVLRIVHSLWQATVNRIPVRMTLFILATLCLIVLAIHALVQTVFA